MRLAAPVMIVVALTLSLAFVVSLPAIALGMFAWVVARAVGRGFSVAAERLAHTFAPTRTPGEAYLARRNEPPKVEGKTEGKTEVPEAPEVLRKEVDARRSDEEAPTKKEEGLIARSSALVAGRSSPMTIQVCQSAGSTKLIPVNRAFSKATLIRW